ncbi:hypothetical protein BDV36DRAFT_280468 [Aspergillus pseudocaelatus]|uniref:Transmembrane protein n=1 Tax=Aspergillus pseudocaelatus TaxID=1825620 RepID=A0ABQ6WX20_9EURO|nr:hypothetical protein BDV36DRAFT_280468 [Aspergillus pseudocaelatus]
MRFRHKPTVKVDHYPLDQYPSISETPIAGHEPDGIPRNQEQVCQWGIGWKTTFILSGRYIMALALAITHLVVFRHLDKNFEDDPKIPSQSHVTAASTILANVVGFLIRICLAAAFTQYFWHLVRITPMQLQTLELLYSIRGSPTSFFSMTALQKGWMLVVITVIFWAIPIAMSFPSSAMTVKNAIYTHIIPQIVPSMVPQETWGGNTTELLDKGLAMYVTPSDADANALDNVQVVSIDSLCFVTLHTNVKPVVQRLATESMVNRAPRTMDSPCGMNCSYEISFDGPYFNCNHTLTEHITPGDYNTSSAHIQFYASNWTTAQNKPDGGIIGDYRIKSLEVHVFFLNASSAYQLSYATHALTCRPSRAKYHVVQQFRNGQQSSTVTTRDAQDLVLMDEMLYFSKDNMTAGVIDQIRDRNIMTLIVAMANVLTGTVTGVTVGVDNGSIPQQAYVSGITVTESASVMSTRLYRPYSNSWKGAIVEDWGSLLDITEDNLNSMLANITLSVINQFQLNTATTNVTRHDLCMQFAFSRPLNLLLSFSPWNGVPATDNGFLQVAMTTLGSPELDQLAKGGCLGGNYNESAQLKQLEVQFGVVSRANSSREEQNSLGASTSELRMAGFAPRDEVTPLLRGKRYGVTYDDKVAGKLAMLYTFSSFGQYPLRRN